ncbi:anion permease, partial [Salmonella enterica subsp. enterica serovar Kentucky]|nr:anion permease [Salmonella enterica subsp. enterica serovar Kentucky]
MSTHLEGFSPDATVIVLVLVFYFAHYLFASLSAHTATMLPIFLDSIGTLISAVLLGPFIGMLTGLLTNLLWGLLTDPIAA